MTRQRTAVALIGLALAAATFAGCGGDSDQGGSDGGAEAGKAPEHISGPLPAEDGLLFVLGGEGEVTDGTVEVETDVVQWFTDRPARRAGVADVRELVDNWRKYGFAADPPNAALRGGGIQAAAELSDPRFDRDRIAFSYKAVGGSALPEGGVGELSVFIDDAIYDPESSNGRTAPHF